MADEEKKEEQGDADVEEQAKPKSKKKLFLIVGGVFFLLLAIGVPVAVLTLGGDEETEDSEMVDPEVAKLQQSAFPEGFEDEDEFDEEEEPLGAFYPMETFIVNLAGHKKYMRLRVQLEFQGRDIPKRFFARSIPVRDAVLQLLSAKPPEEVSGPDGKEQLREDIKETINETLRKELVKQVYFTQLIIQ